MGLKDRIIVRASIGAGLSVIIGVIITTFTSSYYADGKIALCSQGFNEFVGDELAAFVIQALLMAIYGAFAMGGSIVYDLEDWSLLKATLTHFFGVMLVYFAMAFFLRWINVTDLQSIAFISVAMVIPYVIIWLINYLVYKLQINQINEGLEVFKSRELVE